MTWVAGEQGDWHYIIKTTTKGEETGCGTLFATGSHRQLLSGEEPPYIRIFDPPLPICQGCKDYKTLRELAE